MDVRLLSVYVRVVVFPFLSLLDVSLPVVALKVYVVPFFSTRVYVSLVNVMYESSPLFASG